MKIRAGLLPLVTKALGSFTGRKGVPLSVRLSNVRRRIQRYEEAWRVEELNAAIIEFMGSEDATGVPQERNEEFYAAYKDLFEMEIDMPDVEPIKVSMFPDTVELTNDLFLDVLLQEGVLIDDTSTA